MKAYRLFLLVICCTLLSSCHVGRFFIWNFADINDKNKFKAVEIKAPENSFQFTEVAASQSPVKLPESIRVKGERYSFEEGLKESKTVAFLVIRNDSLLYENYLYKYDEEETHTSFSVAKSFVSAMIGIAIEEGYIKSVQEPISTYLPDLHPELIDTIVIEDLLDMRSGITFNEGYYNPFGHVAKFYYGTNIRKYVSQLKSGTAPDQYFSYISSNTQMLAMILENSTGKPVYEYLQEKIWQPLEMESDATWSIDSKKHKMVKAFCCLNATARDFAKFGRLYLNKGNWNGKQVVPESWVDQSTTFDRKKNSFVYSYQWWHIRKYQIESDTIEKPEIYDVVERDVQFGEGGEIKSAKVIRSPATPYYAEGILGQFIYIDPTRDLIIVRLGKKYGNTNWERVFQEVGKLN